MSTDRISSLEARVALTLQLDEIKMVERRNPLSIGDRLERTAEHCWHLAMAALIWASESPVELDVDRAVTLATLHDFPELFVGDHSVYSEHELTRPGRELEAMQSFVRDDASGQAQMIFDLWHDFERGTSPEGRFVQALDTVLPILHNNSSLERSSWRRDRISAPQVRARIDRVRNVLPWLAERAEEIVENATTAGALLREAPEH